MATVILTAEQRSGTNMLRRLLACHPDVYAFQEVFNNLTTRIYMPEGMVLFDDYLVSRVKDDPRAAVLARRTEIVEAYFDYLAEYLETHNMKGIVDVKYSSLHHANDAWVYPGTHPKMLDLFLKKGYKFLHLIREDILGIVYSWFRARETGTYIVFTESEVDPVRISIDPQQFLWRLREINRDREIVRFWLSSAGLDVKEIRYEDLFVAGSEASLQEHVFTDIYELLGVADKEYKLDFKTQKISPLNFKDELENHDDIERILRGTEFHQQFLAHTD